MNSPPYSRVLPLGAVNSIVAGRHGFFLANRYDQYVGLALVRYGEYGELEWRLLAQLTMPGSTVIEVGANIGSHTVSLAKAVGPAGRVIAIEAQRIVHQYLAANIALNALANVACHRLGCGEETGEMRVPVLDYFAPQLQNLGGVSLRPDGEGEPVRIVRLDDLAHGTPVSLIKIDVEGMEAAVLRGAAGLIAANRPILYAENDRPEKSDELISLIWSMDYRAFWHAPPLYNPDNYFGETENIYPNISSFNVLCLPREDPRVLEGFQEITTLGRHPLAKA